MDFITIKFAIFFFVVYFISIFFRNYKKYYPIFLSISSLFFYQLAGLNFTVLLGINIVFNYVCNYKISKSNQPKKYVVLGIIFNILFLGFFKYFEALLSSVFLLPSVSMVFQNVNFPQILIPLGLSFYTFRNISHLIDIYNAKIQLPTFWEFFAYISFFPQIISGPIARAGDFYADLNQGDQKNDSSGLLNSRVLTLLLVGLAKKLVIGSYLFEFAYNPFEIPGAYSAIDLFISSFAFTALIFVDFSAYSDISNAISIVLGFRPTVNFLNPYASIDMKDFWQRWHISFSSWLKDYIYIPLGGNRKGKLRKYLNILITMAVGGLWHGANMTFMVWGILNAFGILFSHMISDLGIKKSANKLIQIISGITTLLFINMCWIFFNSKNLKDAFVFIAKIVTFDQTLPSKLIDFKLVLVIIIAILWGYFDTVISKKVQDIFNLLNYFSQLVLGVILFYIIIRMGPTTIPPFIYFRF